MLSAPERFLELFRDAGADSLTVHLEAAPDPGELIGGIRELGLGCGIALNPATSRSRGSCRSSPTSTSS